MSHDDEDRAWDEGVASERTRTLQLIAELRARHKQRGDSLVASRESLHGQANVSGSLEALNHDILMECGAIGFADELRAKVEKEA